MKSNKIITIRYISIIGILVLHFLGYIYISILNNKGFSTSGLSIQKDSPTYVYNLLDFLCFSLAMNLFKPATIFFFLISGYLFEINFSKYRDSGFRTFVQKKFRSLLKPYLLVFVLPTFLIALLVKPFLGPVKSDISILSAAHELLVKVAFSNYWFIPVLVLYFLINFFIKKDYLVRSLILSVAITLFYSLNIYTKFIPITTHTIAIPGFMTFFFLGRWFHARGNKLLSINRSVNIALVFLLLIASIYESYLIWYKFHNVDFFNTLKISTILYSILLFNLFVKYVSLEELITPNFFKPYNSYFIYLIHPFFVGVISKFLVSYPHLFTTYSLIKALFITLVSIIFTFLVSRLILNIPTFRSKRLEQVLF